MSFAFFLLALREVFRYLYLQESSVQFLRYSLLCEPPIIAFMSEGCAYQFVERMARPRRIAFLGVLFVFCSLAWAAVGMYHPSLLLQTAGDVVPVVTIGVLEKMGAFLILILSVGLLWRLENILRESEGGLRWRVKYAVLGIFIIGGEFIWEMGYRLAYLKVVPGQFAINSLVLISGVAFFVFAVVRHRLFEVEVYVSRYVVYRSVVFLGVGLYLIILGLITTVIRYTGISYSELIWQAFLYLSLLALIVVALSQDVRNKIRFFINTHFFANKYDYRKEWVEFSEKLLEVKTEREILSKLEKMIYETMFINWVTIWLSDRENVFKPVVPAQGSSGKSIDSGHPFVKLLKQSSYLLSTRKYGYVSELGILRLPGTIESFLEKNNIALAMPLVAKGEFLGFIGVGPELTELDYGQDDIDLLKGLASQTATALNMVRLHDELVQNQKLHLFNQLSIFVMHDLKNAASLLSLVLQNAPSHMDDPDFQEDLLATIASASKRLEKVMSKLRALKPPEEQELKPIDVSRVITGQVNSFRRICHGVEIEWEPKNEVYCLAHEELLKKVLENLVINAKDAMNGRGKIRIFVENVPGNRVKISVSDDGPGIPREFLEDKLFKPFHTTKEDGLGIGLWQVKNFVETMQGTISVETVPGRGTTFEIILNSG